MTVIAALTPQLAAKHEAMFALEREMVKMPTVDLPIGHDFCEGVYARTMTIPAGVILTSAIHSGECFFVIRSGSIMVTTDDGPKLLHAGHMSMTPAGTKRAGYAMTDTVVTTFHANPQNEQTPEKLWDMLTVPQPDPRLPHHDLKELPDA